MIKFYVHDVLTGASLGELDPKEYSFNTPLWGGGSAELVNTLTTNPDVLKRKTTPDGVALYIKEGSQYLWGGPINSRTKTPGKPELKLKAQHWKAWFYTRLVKDKWFRVKDQYAMAWELIAYATNDYGTPKVIVGSYTSGLSREFTVEPWWSVGQALDTFGQRDGGFEWDVLLRDNSQTGLPEVYVELYPLGQERSSRPTLMLNSTDSTNRISVGDIPEDASEKRSRVWTTGEGQWPEQPTSKDEDPNLSGNTVLLRETVTNYQSVSTLATLFDHARSERIARSLPQSKVSVTHPIDQPSITSYRVGDRARLRVKDEWFDFDFKGVRVTDKAISKHLGQPSQSTVVLDLTDIRGT